MRISRTPTVLFAVLSLAGCGASSAGFDGPEGTDPAEQGSAVSYRALWSSGAYYVTTTADQASRSTGALFTPLNDWNGNPLYGLDGSRLRGTCGITFITRRYGITAAHCVRARDLPIPSWQPLTVEMYRPTGDILWNLWKVTSLTGANPNFQHGTLSASDGYIADRFDNCFVVTRCGSDWGPKINCNLEADVALIRCNDPVAVGNYTTMPVAGTDDSNLKVSANWAHEIYDVPQGNESATTWQEVAQILGYTSYNENDYPNSAVNNYHYNQANQLIAVGSQTFYENGQTYLHTKGGFDGTVRWTNIWGCHGTSGAGIYQLTPSGAPELLGPVAQGWGEWGNTLCMNAPWPAVTPGMAYTKLDFTRSVAWTAWLDSAEW